MKGPRFRHPSDSQSSGKDQKPDSQNSLAPPRRPAGAPSDTPDYFNSVHNPFSLEPNPFEQSFSTLAGASSAGGYNWSNSLRSGPLSPAMLPGPTGSSDYFDSIGRGFPTPNESSLRTGLTPGGGGSMFPAPSPNSQALLQQLQNGGATPSTIEFHRTALTARKNSGNGQGNEQDQAPNATMDIKPQIPAEQFTQHDAADAANGLFMLAKGGQANNMQANQNMQNENRAARRVSSNTNGTSGREMSGEGSEQELSRPSGKGKGKKNAIKAAPAANNRRKAEDAPKGSNKKAKHSSLEPPSDLDSDDEDMKKFSGDPKKMTDEEKRRNFLERNRVAALKCRQRKKQWLANLQNKVELFTTENDALTATVTQLREEIVNLKTLLLAHKDCPVSQAQGLGPLMMNGMSTGYDPHGYAHMPGQMGMPPGPIPSQMRRA
ncbi:hypothetical protein N7454_008333 [Penicillium verhagenii]|nr:hypothetical protein N7454_008333 [Penicillium verhagenii]